MIAVCDSNIHALLLPSRWVKKGIGSLSAMGAQTNLKEYPNAAQLKKVTADRSIPASLNQRPKEENISNNGMPAEKPKKSMVITLGCKNA